MDNKGLRDRVKSLEQELRAAKACAAISRSKAERALESEKLILDSVKEANEGLLCKNRRAPEPFSLIVSLENFLFDSSVLL